MRKTVLRTAFPALIHRLMVLGLACCGGSICSAGVLLLSNGDRISGELIIISNGQLHWQSELMGEVVVPQTNVSGVDARDQFEVELDERRQLTGCELQLGADQQQLLSCRQGIVEVSSWKTVARVSARPLEKRNAWRSKGDVSVALRDSAGNTEQQGVAIDVRASWRKTDKRHTLKIDYQTQRERDIKTEDNRALDYQFDKFVSDKWFLRGTVGWERNLFQDLERRTLFGAGVGYQFVDTELMRLSVEGGPAYVAERYDTDPDRNSLALRLGTDFSAKINKFGLQFFHRNTLLQMLNESGDWRLKSETGFRLPIVGRLSAQAKLKFDYANMPAEDADALDRTWSFGVNYGW
jgi:putative salt-induced outer membrane protein YdiY